MLLLLILLITIFILGGIGQSDFLVTHKPDTTFKVDKDAWMDDDLYLDDNENY